MTQLFVHPFLLPILVPCIAGILCLVLPRRVSAFISVLAGIVTVVLVWPLFRMESETVAFGRFITLHIDGLNGVVLLAAAVFGFLIILYSLEYMKDEARGGRYYAYLLWTIGVSCGVLLANEFILLLTLWGFLGLTLYLLIDFGGPDASSAAKKSLVIIGGSDGIMLLGIAVFRLIRGTTSMAGTPVPLDGTPAYIAFICLAIGAFAKAGAMPFHSWVPDCGEKAPAPVAALLPAALDKLLGIYLLARLAGPIFQMSHPMRTVLMVIGAASILMAVMMALVQHDMKRLLSYHAVSQVGYMVLGIATGVPVAVAGALFHMINNVIYKTCLFLCAGAVEKRVGTTDLDKLGGLAAAMPVTFGAALVSALAISGIPPLNGFASKWMIYQGLLESGETGGWLWAPCLVAALLGSALTLASFVKLLHAVFLRKRAPGVATRDVSGAGFSMRLPMALLALLCVLFGVLAYRLPLSYLVLPAVGEGVSFPGTWWSGPATVMLLASIVVGFIVYWIGTVSGSRTCGTYVGGERMDKTYVSGEAAGEPRDIEVSGVDFYETVRSMTPFRQIYRMADIKLFDIYDIGTRCTMFASNVCRFFHSGVLRTYIIWYIIGLLVLMFTMKRSV